MGGSGWRSRKERAVGVSLLDSRRAASPQLSHYIWNTARGHPRRCRTNLLSPDFVRWRQMLGSEQRSRCGRALEDKNKLVEFRRWATNKFKWIKKNIYIYLRSYHIAVQVEAHCETDPLKTDCFWAEEEFPFWEFSAVDKEKEMSLWGRGVWENPRSCSLTQTLSNAEEVSRRMAKDAKEEGTLS